MDLLCCCCNVFVLFVTLLLGMPALIFLICVKMFTKLIFFDDIKLTDTTIDKIRYVSD